MLMNILSGMSNLVYQNICNTAVQIQICYNYFRDFTTHVVWLENVEHSLKSNIFINNNKY